MPVLVQDGVVAAATFGVGTVLYLTGLYPLAGSSETAPLPLRFAVFGALCCLEVLRRQAPGPALAAGSVLVAVDVTLGSSVPAAIVLFDLLYAAALYGSRRLSRALVPLIGVCSLGAVAAAIVLADQWREVVVTGLAVVPFLVIPVWWATNVRRHRDVAEAERAGAAALSRLAELDRAAAVASERARMARDLHDIVAGHLSAIAIQSEAALSLHDPGTAATHGTGEALRSVRENSVRALEEMRAMIGLLRSEEEPAEVTAPCGLAQLPILIESARASGMRVTIDTAVGTDLPAAVDLAAYRITQEALTNSVKHAAGSDTMVSVRYVDDALVIEITNAAPRGANAPAQQLRASGTGLLNMTERAHALGGSLSAGPSSEGWRVRAELPTVEVRP